MSKILIITVGTGTGSDERSQRLAQALIYSIREQNPDRVIFLVSEESERETLPYILEELGPDLDYEMRRLTEIGNVESVYQQTVQWLRNLLAQDIAPHEVTVDYTSGTKAMSAGATIAAAALEGGTLSYVNGQREQGIVIPGTEELRILKPYHIVIDKRLKELKVMFNRYQFDAALALLDGLLDRVYESRLREQLERYRELYQAYRDWDRFDHGQAIERLEPLEIAEFDVRVNVSFLSELRNRREDREMFYIVDLLNNAERRAEEAKYDDAVARLYRAVELIGQRQLRLEGVIDEELLTQHRIYKAHLDSLSGKLPGEALQHLESQADENRRAALGLRDSYRLLADLGDALGERYLGDKELQDLLSRRNRSILAHGLEPISQMDCGGLRGKVVELASSAISRLEEVRARATFPKFAV